MSQLTLRPPRGPHQGLPGHPLVVDAIAAEIQRFGPISFARFMDLALSHPMHGYYMRLEHKPDAEIPEHGLAEDRIGWAGDYLTNSDVSSVFSHAVAKQMI